MSAFWAGFLFGAPFWASLVLLATAFLVGAGRSNDMLDAAEREYIERFCEGEGAADVDS